MKTKTQTTTGKTVLAITTSTRVVFDKQKTIDVLENGMSSRGIWRPEDYVEKMGFELTAIKALEKTHRSAPKVKGEEYDITEQIFVNGKRVAKLKGVSCYDFLFWFGEEVLGVSIHDIMWGRPAIEASQMRKLILEKLKDSMGPS